MSAGAGISHSEYNHSDQEIVNFLQVWVLPDAKMHQPRYDQKTFDPRERKNKFQTVVAPGKNSGALWLNQDAYFSLADVDEGNCVEYSVHDKSNGIYLFVIDGEVEIAGEKLGRRDGMGIWEIEEIKIDAVSKSQILLIEVPMN
jgi:redox-sensitive bicupin YhaK (pirin superfamily)